MESSDKPSSLHLSDLFSAYWDIFFGIIFGILAFLSHTKGLTYTSTILAAISIGALSVTISEIAEILAERLGEPYGSFVLTFSAVAVEILLLFMILNGEGHSTVESLATVKSGIISAVIVDMNVLLGLAVFVGGLAFKEQEHNEDTSSTYTTILFVSALALLVPSLLQFSDNPEEKLTKASVIISVMLILFYVIIYIFQTKTHSHFFKSTARSRIMRMKRKIGEEEEEEEHYIFDKFPNFLNLFIIFLLILYVGFVAEIFATDGMPVFKELGISTGLAGLIIAIISVSPELFTAIKAAKDDQIQRVINIAMGASTVSILLTVPILMFLAYINHIHFTLDFNSLQIGALIFTVILAWKTTDDGETNYIEGISHLMLFSCFAVIAALY
ncbi:calcium:proton antiporter [Nitrosophilus kaiyonis]|uniref:calcium:proton antiporter n=1 Tax=Nitrosophilus kaiyonis TaxID=2930200 RepID=UPI002490C5CF|nr:sodium:proton exchanger [Nitrosophilus kaiyonis]